LILLEKEYEDEMSQIQYDDQYVEALRFAIRQPETRTYVNTQLDHSLRHCINLNDECFEAIVSILNDLLNKIINGENLAEQVTCFQKKWRRHLDRVYLHDYEATRWDFMSKYVFDRIIQGRHLGRCLDVGCGRGCVSANLVREGIASVVVGIDTEDFSSEWRERRSSVKKCLKFEQVHVGQIEEWLKSGEQFDSILLFYVLHHAEEYWATRTLQALLQSLRPGGRLIVLEDSIDTHAKPLADNLNLSKTWQDWAGREKVYSLSVAYNVQVILDFVAVQLLAGFQDVHMPCNYRTTNEWKRRFEELDLEVSQIIYIGFPEGRDIDVPQALFVLSPLQHLG
jgi:2-polyprenyl-3-methyl-5-hydroxy-6-metoxy-1,4-benzoquinol methylase